MKWDIFSGRQRTGRADTGDEINHLIKGIEAFAPREYRSERRSYYYNYQHLNHYLNPLFELLAVICRKKHDRTLDEDLISELFLKLKNFYDPKKTLSLNQAIEDKNLRRKFHHLLLIFYDKKETTRGDMEISLQKLGSR